MVRNVIVLSPGAFPQLFLNFPLLLPIYAKYFTRTSTPLSKAFRMNGLRTGTIRHGTCWESSSSAWYGCPHEQIGSFPLQSYSRLLGSKNCTVQGSAGRKVRPPRYKDL